MPRITEPSPGQLVSFIRWIRSRDGWSHETLNGTFERRTETCWRIWVNEQLRELPEAQWTLYET